MEFFNKSKTSTTDQDIEDMVLLLDDCCDSFIFINILLKDARFSTSFLEAYEGLYKDSWSRNLFAVLDIFL